MGDDLNISCNQCGGRFSIAADQLGTRGECPHCRAAIVLPRENRGIQRQREPIKPPGRWIENTLIGSGAIAVNLLALVLLTTVPWTKFSEAPAAQGERVLIGQLPRQILVDDPDRQFEQIQSDHPLHDNLSEAMDSERIVPSSVSRVAENQGDAPFFSPSSGGSVSFEVEFPLDTNVLEASDEDFGNLLARLKKDGLDIVITFDSTGSMQGEIDQVKDQIERIGGVLFKLIPKTRISICTYRDQGDAYVVKGLPLTDNLAEIVLYLSDIQAAGGGDEPEAVDDGLQWSIEKNDFRRRARKVILLFGDAPPRASRVVRCQKMVSDFRNAGGVVSTVTCRKPDRMDEFVSIAQLGRGESFLTQDEQQIMSQLIVLVFGSQHRAKVLEAFDLLQPGLGQ